MLVLAIETSARHFSLALLSEGVLVSEIDSRSWAGNGNDLSSNAGKAPEGLPNRNIGRKPGVSVTLFPALAMLLQQAKVAWSDIGLIAIATGPGMFTGLRVGVVAAKTLAYVHQIPLIGVNTLQVIAAQSISSAERETAESFEENGFVRPVLNAQRQQVFSGCYQFGSAWNPVSCQDNEILDSQSWLSGLTENSIVTGSGLKLLGSELEEHGCTLNEKMAELKIRIAPESTWDCSAEGVARVGRSQFLAGNQSDVWSLEPFYFRPSTAEEVLIKRTEGKSQV